MPMRILAVEDSQTQAEALKALLEGAGYTVGLAASGEEALRALGEQPADLVVADIVMPGMDGYELCRRIKADRTLRELPVVLLTSLGDPLDIARGLECGADNYIIKPYEAAQLLARLRHVLDSRTLRRKAVTRVGIQVSFLGRSLTITSDREQILDLLISTFEDIVRTNDKLQTSQAELADANAQLEAYARRMAVQARVSVEKYWTLMEHAAANLLRDSPRRSPRASPAADSSPVSATAGRPWRAAPRTSSRPGSGWPARRRHAPGPSGSAGRPATRRTRGVSHLTSARDAPALRRIGPRW